MRMITIRLLLEKSLHLVSPFEICKSSQAKTTGNLKLISGATSRTKVMLIFPEYPWILKIDIGNLVVTLRTS